MSTDPDRVHAAVTRDCAHRLRVAYVLPRAVAFDDLAGIIAEPPLIDEFSKIVDGALDHFRFRVSDHSLASGIVGGRSLVLTYGRLSRAADVGDRVRVERFLGEIYGRVVPLSTA